MWLWPPTCGSSTPVPRLVGSRGGQKESFVPFCVEQGAAKGQAQPQSPRSPRGGHAAPADCLPSPSPSAGPYPQPQACGPRVGLTCSSQLSTARPGACCGPGVATLVWHRGRPQASILQLAVKGRVFLLDLPVFSRPVGGQVSQAFCRLVSQMLSDPSITKLGKRRSCHPRGGCWRKAGAPSLGARPTDRPPRRLRDVRGPSEPGASCPALAHVEKELRGSLDLLQVHRQVSGAGGGGP